MSNFSDKSYKVLLTLHPDLQKIMILSLQRSCVDFGLHEGARTVPVQQAYYMQGKSSINPANYEDYRDLAKVAKHIVLPDVVEFSKSRAVDLHSSESYNGKSLAWDTNHLSYIAGIIQACAKELYNKGEIRHIIRWGGDWDSDGVIGFDHKLKDFPHHELILP
ncbi:MAG: hypothetical protein QNK20_16770 [Aureibaculum sp.]|nr:hypothetical protein [Aureibaculum sp.]